MFSLFIKDIWDKIGWRAIGLVLLSLLSGLLSGSSTFLLIPLLNRMGVDWSSGGGALVKYTEIVVERLQRILPGGDSLFSILVIVILAYLVLQAFNLTYWFVAGKLTSRYTATWRENLFDSILRSQWKFFTTVKAGSLVNILASETNRIDGAFRSLLEIITTSLFAVSYLVIAFVVSWKVSLCVSFFGVVLFFCISPIKRASEKAGQSHYKETESIHTFAGEVIRYAKYIKSCACEERASTKLNQVFENLRRLGVLATILPNLARSLSEFGGILLLTITLALGVTYFQLSSASILLVLVLFFRILPRVSSANQNFQNLVYHLPGLAASVRLMKQTGELREDVNPDGKTKPFDNVPVEIRIKDVCVELGNAKILDHVSLDIPAGRVIAFTGGSGAGKSTLVDCILGLVKTVQGEILINGTPLHELRLDSWRKAVGYVTQDAAIFNTTVIGNIAWHSEEGGREAVENAARISNAHEFIREIDGGYDAFVGEQGALLSGGQRQRVGLARAFMGRKSLLILDEATSALDSTTEAKVMENIESFRGKSTIILIAHRYSTLRNVDYIYHMENGRIVESGTWDELISREGKFNETWKMQSS